MAVILEPDTERIVGLFRSINITPEGIVAYPTLHWVKGGYQLHGKFLDGGPWTFGVSLEWGREYLQAMRMR